MSTLTDQQIVEIRDEHLPNQGERFDCIAFARAIERALLSKGAAPAEPVAPAEFEKALTHVCMTLHRYNAAMSRGDMDTEALMMEHIRAYKAAMALAAPKAPTEPEIRRNEDGTLDEVVATGQYHLEQMSATHWWMAVQYPGGRVTVNLHSKATIKGYAEIEPDAAALPVVPPSHTPPA